MSAWADLPYDLLLSVRAGLTDVADVARFSSVCRSWRSVAADVPLPSQPPWLLFPKARIFSTFGDRAYRLPDLAVTAAGDRRLFASPNGQILAVGDDNSALLVHPLTGDSVPLPPFPLHTSSPFMWDVSPHGVLLASQSHGFCFCSPGDAAWTDLDALILGGTTSVTYSDGNFFLFDEAGCSVRVIDAASKEITTVIEKPEDLVTPPFGAWLAVGNDKLFLVVKDQWDALFADAGLPHFSSVFHVDYKSEQPEWIKVNNIGDLALFIDSLHSFAVDASAFHGLKRNCIYFDTEVESRTRTARGIKRMKRYGVSLFCLEDGQTKPLYSCEVSRETRGTPQWIIPARN